MSATPWTAGALFGSRRSRVLFGWSYEDETIELAAFGAPGRVCTIAAAGETAAACAQAGHDVTAVDINAVQLAYCRDRLAGGPARRGTAEQMMRIARRVLGLVAPPWRTTRLVAELTDPERADGLWDHLDTAVFRWGLAAVLAPSGLLARLLRPEFAAVLGPGFASRLRDRLGRGLARHGAGDNRFAWRLLAGVELPGWQLPAPRGSLALVDGDVTAHLAGVEPGTYRGVSLSNVVDGAAASFVTRLLTHAQRALAPDGVIVVRTLAPGATLERQVRASGLSIVADVTDRDRSLLWGRVLLVR